MKAPYTIFGKTKLVNVEVWQNGKRIESDTWDKEMWVERDEDMYGLISTGNKKVRVIHRNEWLVAEEVEQK